MILAASVLYLLALVAIGIWSARRTRSARDFFLAGGRIGLIPAAFATLASIMSGFVFVGGPGLFYSVGLGSFWITISSSFTGALMCWLLARPLYDWANRQGCLTIPEVIHARFGCRFSSGMAALGIVVGVVGYLATQLQALGVILAALLPVSPRSGFLLAAGVLVFYCVAGGMLAGVYTDVVQGALMLWATTLVFVYALQAAGGLEQISRTFLAEQPGLLHPWGLVGPFGALSWFLVFSVGSLGQPHVVHKFMMVRDLRVLRYFPLLLAVSMVLCGLIWLGGGMSVKSLVLAGQLPPLAHPDDAVTVLLGNLVPGWLAALTYVAILAAIMSTADSFVNVGAAALARDLPRTAGRMPARPLFWGRLFSLVLFGAALLFAEFMGELVAYLGIFGFGTFAASLTPALVLGLNWDRAGPWAARASISCGLLLNLSLELAQRLGLYTLEVTPSALTLCLSLLLFVALGYWAPSSPVRTEFSLRS